MNNKDVGKNLGLTAFDDLFETDESRADQKRERIYDISLNCIQSFSDHPYKVRMMTICQNLSQA